MKVVHVLSSTEGGAGIAALRLHNALLKEDVDSKVISLSGSVHSDKISYIKAPFKRRFLMKFLPKFGNRKFLGFNKNIRSNYEIISFPFGLAQISQHQYIKDADIINLHWLGSAFDYKDIFTIEKPIVWTLHDTNPFCGIFHTQIDINNNPDLKELDDNVRMEKQKIYSKCKNLSIVTLSNWMNDLSQNSAAFSGRRHELIPNSLDTVIFKYKEKNILRRALGIPEDKIVLMFCCQSIRNKRKGMNLLLNALKDIDRDVCFITVGAGDLPKYDSVIHFGSTSDERYLAMIYQSADVFILPSLEDNLPNTMIEALCCGTPVITFANGGMKDVIVNNYNGLISETISSEILRDMIDCFLLNKRIFNSQYISSLAQKMFSPNIQANKYKQLYQSLLNCGR